jgi:hypothetical protein
VPAPTNANAIAVPAGGEAAGEQNLAAHRAEQIVMQGAVADVAAGDPGEHHHAGEEQHHREQEELEPAGEGDGGVGERPALADRDAHRPGDRPRQRRQEREDREPERAQAAELLADLEPEDRGGLRGAPAEERAAGRGGRRGAGRGDRRVVSVHRASSIR